MAKSPRAEPIPTTLDALLQGAGEPEDKDEEGSARGLAGGLAPIPFN